jgi:hypothetical protein
MKENHRPLSVAVLAWLYIGVGAVGSISHLSEFQAGNAFPFDGVWIELTELSAVLCGAFMLRACNWARWLALAWMAFHVILSVLDRFHGFAIHCLFSVVIAWVLLRPDAARYFRSVPTEPT